MRWLFFALLYPFVCHADPLTIELAVPDICKDWSTFPVKHWKNNTGHTLQITDVDMKFVGADTLVGELGMWLQNDERIGLLYSFGVEQYANPNGPLGQYWQPSPDARFTIRPDESLTLRANCGPVNGVHFRPFNYFAVSVIHLIEEPQ